MTPRLVDTVLADAFRQGLDEERRELTTKQVDRPTVYARMRQFEADIHGLTCRIERLRGRLMADNKWLELVPDEGA